MESHQKPLIALIVAAILAACSLAPCAAQKIAVMPIDVAVEGSADAAAWSGMADSLADGLIVLDNRQAFDLYAVKDFTAPMGRATLLDAKGYSQRASADYCLYGYCLVGDQTAELAVSLYERSGERVVKTYYAKGFAGEREAIVKEMAGKLMGSMYAALGIEPLETKIPARFLFKADGGWWCPISWQDTMIGCFYSGAYAGISAARKAPIARQASFSWEFGLDALYRMSISAPSVEPYTCHLVKVGIPVALRLKGRGAAGLSVSLEPFYDFSFATVQRRYGGNETVNGGAPGCGLATTFDLYFGKRDTVRVGVGCGVDAAFYKQLAFQASVGLEVEFLFKEM
jgi:hypothetical protein